LGERSSPLLARLVFLLPRLLRSGCGKRTRGKQGQRDQGHKRRRQPAGEAAL
jgi:hypothetical protein